MGFEPLDLIKTKEQIQIMREGGKILGSILESIKQLIKPGVITWDLESFFLDQCEKYKVTPACKGFTSYGLPPFPSGLCVSINNQGPHCFPSKNYKILDSDLVTIDTVIIHQGLHLDAAICKAMPNAPQYKKNIAIIAEKTLYEAIDKVSAGVRIGVISNKIQTTARKYDLNVLRDFAGHGIGVDMHAWPEVPCFGEKTSGPKLREGMTICVEILICRGRPNVKASSTSWETHMADGKEFCQMEHTVLVQKKGYEILTLP